MKSIAIIAGLLLPSLASAFRVSVFAAERIGKDGTVQQGIFVKRNRAADQFPENECPALIPVFDSGPLPDDPWAVCTPKGSLFAKPPKNPNPQTLQWFTPKDGLTIVTKVNGKFRYANEEHNRRGSCTLLEDQAVRTCLGGVAGARNVYRAVFECKVEDETGD